MHSACAAPGTAVHLQTFSDVPEWRCSKSHQRWHRQIHLKSMRPAQRFPFVKWCLSPPFVAVPSPPQHRTSARSHFRAAARRSQADGDDFESLGFDDAAFAALETDFENVRPPPAAPGALAWASVDAQVCTEPPPLLRPFRRFFKSSAPTRSSSASASSTRRCTVRSRSRTNRRSGW